jgi:hypothetical protein
MSDANEQTQREHEGIADEDLPEDLQPTDDNPLAQPLTEEDDPKSAEELDVLGGKGAEQSEESEQPEQPEDETDASPQ